MSGSLRAVSLSLLGRLLEEDEALRAVEVDMLLRHDHLVRPRADEVGVVRPSLVVLGDDLFDHLALAGGAVGTGRKVLCLRRAQSVPFGLRPLELDANFLRVYLEKSGDEGRQFFFCHESFSRDYSNVSNSSTFPQL